MAKLVVLFAFLVLLGGSALLVTASEEANGGFPIPLIRRGAAASVGIRAEVASAVASFNKIQRGLRDLQAKDIALPDGAQILDFRNPDGSPVNSQKKRRTTVALGATEGSVGSQLWVGTISAGTPPQTFTCDFDTVSDDMWIAAAGCSGCQTPYGYNPSASSTFQLINGTFDTDYDDGSEALGAKVQDVVTVGNVTAQHQTFAAITSGGSGINLGGTPFVINAFSQGAISTQTFSFKFGDGPGTGELFIGGSNPALYKGPFEVHSIYPRTMWWALAPGNISGNAQAITNDTIALIDTASSLIIGPIEQVQELHANIPGAVAVNQSGVISYTYDCGKALPNVTVQFDNGKAWPLTTETLQWSNPTQGASCTTGIVGLDLGLGDNHWLFGQNFLRNMYTRFDFGQMPVFYPSPAFTVSFAELA